MNVAQAIESAKAQPWGRVIEVTATQRLQDKSRGASAPSQIAASLGRTMCICEDDGAVLRYSITGVFDSHPSTIPGCRWNGYKWTF
jgi:hypothetical protein